MPNEEIYPTRKIFKCDQCGNVFLDGFTDAKECPECNTVSKTPFRPDEHNAEAPEEPV